MEHAPTHDAWRRALMEVEDQEITVKDPNVVTTAEFMALVGINRATAASKLRKLVAAGRATLTKRTMRRTDGGIQTVPAYRLTPRAIVPPTKAKSGGRRGRT